MKDFFDRNEVVGVLQGFNPWWSGKPYSIPEFRRIAFGTCLGYLEDRSLKRAVLLTGPRRVGKTTILTQVADSLIKKGSDPKSIIYLSLDHPLLKLLDLRQILSLYHENIYPPDRETFLLLDEVQYSKEWETEVKLLVDHRPNFRILATGSASVVHKEKLAESGVGRWITVPIPTLSFYEFIHIRDEQIPDVPADMRLADVLRMKAPEFVDLAARFKPLLPLFQQYLLVGGFPETARQKNISLCQRLLREDVVERVLKRDMTALFGVRNVNDLEKLFIYLCLHSGGILAVQPCAAALGATMTTVNNHLALLEQANLVYRLPPAEVGGKRVLKARNKYYLVDAALRNAVLLRGEEILTNSEEMGIVAETTVLRHLYAHYYRDMPEIVYWRDVTTNKEVDIIIRSPKFSLPFEVKYRENPDIKKDSGLMTFCRLDKPKWAFWVTKNDRDFGTAAVDGLDTVFLQIPAHILCYLLGQAERLYWT